MVKFMNMNAGIIFFSVICFFDILSLDAAVAGHHRQQEDAAAGRVDDYHHVKVSSLFPQESCTPSTRSQKRGATLEVVHSYGPCSKFKPDGTNSNAAHLELLEKDEARVKYIRSRVNLQAKTDKVAQKAVSIPAQSGSSIGSGNYVVSVGLGSPARQLYLIFDTGSDFTWTQCQPCVGTCYPQVNPIFNPSTSKTYVNISCSSGLCASIASATSATPGCASSTCVYGIQYGDSSFSVGFYATDTLTLSSGNVFPNFKFGCGENNQGLFRGSAGLLGLGRNPISAFSQFSTKYGKVFSYCLPTKSGSGGSLTFGTSGTASSYTPLLTRAQNPTFYFLSLQGISVGGTTLSIPPSVFSTAGTLIDSGTVITRLPPAAYSALKTAFKQLMSNYPTTSALSILDTCFDFSSYSTISVPVVSLLFSGGAQLRLGIPGILYGQSISQVCLAFAGNSDSSAVGIIGNTQQQTFNVIYDVAGGRIGFTAGGCS